MKLSMRITHLERSDALGVVVREHAIDQVLGDVRDARHRGPLKVANQDIVKDLVVGRAVKRRHTRQHHEKNHTARPHVGLLKDLPI